MPAEAETLVLRSGVSGTGTGFRREGDRILFSREVRGPDGKMNRVESGVAVAEIQRVESEMPAALKNAPALLAGGNGAKVLPEVSAALKAAEPLAEFPGSWWPQLAILQAHTLVALGRDADAIAVASALEKSKDAGLSREGKAVQALLSARKGDHDAASMLALPIWKEKDSTRPSAVAAVCVARGLGFLEKKQYVPALKSFLELPVFLPEETALSAMAQFGAAEAYFGLEDYDRAIATLEELIKAQPAAPESAKAKTLLPQWQQRRKAVNEAGQT